MNMAAELLDTFQRWRSSNVKIGGSTALAGRSAQPFARHAVRMGGIHSRVSDKFRLMNSHRIFSSRERRAVRNVRQSQTLDEVDRSAEPLAFPFSGSSASFSFVRR